MGMKVYEKIKQWNSDLYISSGMICDDDDCPHNRECANHSSAGDFRTEGGMSPDIKKFNGQLCCTKQDTGIQHGFVDSRGISYWIKEIQLIGE